MRQEKTTGERRNGSARGREEGEEIVEERDAKEEVCISVSKLASST